MIQSISKLMTFLFVVTTNTALYLAKMVDLGEGGSLSVLLIRAADLGG